MINVNNLKQPILIAVNFLLRINLKASIIYLLIVSAISVTGSQLFFDDYSDLYGPMAGNLKLMLIYLCFTVLAVYGLSNFGEHLALLLALGMFLLLMAAGVEFYSEINQVPVDERYRWLFIYCGLSQLLFAGFGMFSRQAVRH